MTHSAATSSTAVLPRTSFAISKVIAKIAAGRM